MKHRNPHIQEELKEISPAVANLPVKTPFDLPESYFEQFPDRVMARIREGLSASEELEQLSPLLAGLKKQSPFEVPEGYFQSLEPGRIGKEAVILPLHNQVSGASPAGTGEPQYGKVHSIGRWQSGLRWAAAAVIAGLLFGAIYLTGNRDEVVNADPSAMAEAENTQKGDSLPFTAEALAGFLDGTEAIPDEDLALIETLQGESMVSADFSDRKFEEILGEIPDVELEAFFRETPESPAINSMN